MPLRGFFPNLTAVARATLEEIAATFQGLFSPILRKGLDPKKQTLSLSLSLVVFPFVRAHAPPRLDRRFVSNRDLLAPLRRERSRREGKTTPFSPHRKRSPFFFLSNNPRVSSCLAGRPGGEARHARRQHGRTLAGSLRLARGLARRFSHFPNL